MKATGSRTWGLEGVGPVSTSPLNASVHRTALFSGIEHDLALAERAIEASIASADPVLTDIATHLLKAGGKRIRPALAILAARMFRYDESQVMPVAAAIELIHMATLVHDDIIDRSVIRRGAPTVNARWGTPIAVLMGDYLYAKAFSLLADRNQPVILRIMADVVFEMSKGEIEQQQAIFNLALGEDDYMERIRRKTALFIAESCRLGAIVGGADHREVDALFRFGLNLGYAFQIVDDVLDFTSNVRQIGKPVGSDLRSGLITLPVLHALRHSPKAAAIRRMIETRSVDDAEVQAVTAHCEAAGSFAFARAQARAFHELASGALSELPASPMRDTLAQVADFVIARDY